VWKSADRGAHWKLWSTGLPRIAVGALATNPTDGAVWAGLGEANTNFDAANGMGIFRLAPGASRWTRVGGTEMSSRNTYQLRFIGGRAHAATSSGLWRHGAGNASAAWNLVLKPDPNPDHSVYRTSQVTSVVAVPGSGGSTSWPPWGGAAARCRPTPRTTASRSPTPAAHQGRSIGSARPLTSVPPRSAGRHSTRAATGSTP